MPRIAAAFWLFGILCVIAGMALGMHMGESRDFTLAPVHAHINLLGWASMMIYGLYYRAVPAAATGALPVIHFVVNVISVLVSMPLLVVLLLDQATNKPHFGLDVKTTGMILGPFEAGILLSMLIFAFIVWFRTGKSPAAA